MNYKIFFLLAAALFMVGAVGLFHWGARANGQSLYAIDFWTMDGGGASVSGANSYTLQGTIGQSEAQAATWSAPGEENEYRLIAGFWGYILARSSLFLPMILR